MARRPDPPTPPLVLPRDKPAGATSHDVVAEVRRERGLRRVGHAGTLDPFATGLLLVLIGRATRLQRYLLEPPKTYVATARLGWTSTTGDPDGELVETGKVPERLELPTGRVRQRVPLTSAVKVEGERLYRRAHRGEGEDSVERPEREVTVHSARLLGREGERATFEITCSSGTYVRTLIETLGDAYCESLRRTAIGAVRVERAGEELSPAEALGHLPARELDEREAREISFGRPIEAGEDGGPAVAAAGSGAVALLFERSLVAVGRPDARTPHLLRPEVVLEPSG